MIDNMVLHYVERPGWWNTAVLYLQGEEVTTDARTA